MIYFDSDVVYHTFIVQEERKHEESLSLLLRAIKDGKAAISTLLVQELGYAMANNGLPQEEIENHLIALTKNYLISVNHLHMVRAISLATKIGFKHINDCIHTAVAEILGCEKLYTYNNSDFRRIQKHTDLNIVIL